MAALPEPLPLESKIRIGSCAWNFDDWRGPFYPANLPSNQELGFYSRHLSFVEIDSTFYHIPSAIVVAGWAARTPDDFVFAAKMPRQITHDARLRNCQRELDAFLASLRPLGEKLGPVLIQFPASFTRAQDEKALREFIGLLPAKKISFAVEFRHANWHIAEIVNLLRDHGVAWAWNDLSTLDEQGDFPAQQMHRTADFIYLRLMGDQKTKFRADGEREFRYQSLMWPREGGLHFWAERLKVHLAATRMIYIAVNNHFEGLAPATVQRLARLLGIEVTLPSPPAPNRLEKQLDLL